MPKTASRKKTAGRRQKSGGKPQFKNAAFSDAGPQNPVLGNRSAGSDSRSIPSGVITGKDRDYFRETTILGGKLNQSVQPTITPERVTQSVRMRFNPLRNLSPERVVTYLEQWRLGFFRNAGMMWDVMERRDYQLQVVAPKRKKSVARHGYDVTKLATIPSGLESLADEQQEFLKYFWDHITVTTALDPDEEGGFGLLARQMLDAIGKHYAVHEIIYQPQPDGNLTAKFIACPIWWFEGTRGKLRFLDSEFQVYGRDMEPGEWLVTIHDGIMEACSILFLFKWNALKAWSIFLDRFGQPGVQGLTDAQKGTREWEDFRSAVKEFSEEYAVVTNRSCEIKLIEAAANGSSGGLFETLTKEMNTALTLLWRGSDLGTNSRENGTGASLQQDESEILETDDAKIIEETLMAKVSRFALAWKFGADAPQLANLILRTAPQKATAQDLQIDEFLLANNCSLDKGETYERYGRNQPSADMPEDELIQPVTPPAEAEEIDEEEDSPEAELNNQFANASPEQLTQLAEAQADDFALLRHLLSAIESITDENLLEQKLRELVSDHGPLVVALANMNAYPKAAQTINDLLTQQLAKALSQPAKTSGKIKLT